MRISVAPEGIIPVYGKVAYNARQLKRNKENETLKQQAIRDLQGWYEGPSGEGQVVPEIPTEEVVRILEKKSGIKDLEAQ